MNFLKSLFGSYDNDLKIEKFVVGHFGYKPKGTDTYKQALRHSSAAVKITGKLKNSNERLEYLGDAVIDAVVADYLFRKYPEKTEGQLTKMKSKVVSRAMLNNMGMAMGIPDLLELKLGNQEMHQSIVGNAFEAVVGALYLDKGYDYSKKVLVRLFQKYDIDDKVHELIDFKSRLHEWCQKNKKTLSFKVLNEEDMQPNTDYEIALSIDGKEFGVGKGASKKAAEQRAAEQAYKKLF